LSKCSQWKAQIGKHGKEIPGYTLYKGNLNSVYFYDGIQDEVRKFKEKYPNSDIFLFNFDDFVNQQVSEANNIDWQKRIDEWKSDLEDLYKMVKDFIKEYLLAEKMALFIEPMMITEEYVGQYDVYALIIKIGKNNIRLEPIGTLIIGAKGRVDMIGPTGKVRLVLVDKNSSVPKLKVRVNIKGESFVPEERVPSKIEWEWKIITSLPVIKYIDLNQKSFFDAILEVAHV
jgi:hypothetical protein